MAIEVKVREEKEIGAHVFTFVFGKHEFPAIKGMSGFMRDSIPSSAREYNANTHEWTVLSPFWKSLKEMFEKAGWKITDSTVIPPEDFFYNQGTAKSVDVSREELANQLLALLGITAQELADSNAAKKAYRRKALELHPDRNQGDGSKMSELNSTWTAYNNVN
jgi:hypothetical protein